MGQVTRRGQFSVPAALRLKRPRPIGQVSPSLEERIQSQQQRKVTKLELEGPDRDTFFQKSVHRIPVSGDHVYCAEIVGGLAVYIHFDQRDNPGLRLHEGMTIQRRYDQLLVTFDYPLVQSDGHIPARYPGTRVTLYVSFGPFVLSRPEPRYGAHPGFFSRFDNDATTTPRVAWADAVSAAAWNPAGIPPIEQFGMDGATLVLTNTDLVNTLFVKYTDDTDFGPNLPANRRNWYPLEAGMTLTLRMESNMRRDVKSNVISFGNIYVATLVGTCKYAWLLSRGPVFGSPTEGYGGETQR